VIFGVGLSLAYLRFAAFDYLVSIGFAAGSFVLAALASSATKIANQWGRTIVLRLGQFQSMKGPGLIIPIVDSVPYWIDMPRH
jgi:regulator of protease activity HflC (stomatin/prohibitin superfamily)